MTTNTKAVTKPTTHGRVFIYSDDGTVLAHPTMKLVEGTGARGQGKLPTVRDIPDPLVQQYTQALAAMGPGTVGTFNFDHQGDQIVAGHDRGNALQRGQHHAANHAAVLSENYGGVSPLRGSETG